MTSKLKCPFCGEELSPSCGYGIEVYMCPNLTCHEAPGYAEDGVWQALIRAKQDLKVAQKVLNDAKQTLLYCWDVYDAHSAKCTAEDVDKILEQIEQKDVK